MHNVCDKCWGGHHKDPKHPSRENGCRSTRCDCPCSLGGFKVARVPIGWKDSLGVVHEDGLRPSSKDARLDLMEIGRGTKA